MDYKISENLKALRKKNGWSQQKLATEAGLSYNAITKLEQKAATHPTIQTIEKLADAFKISIDELLGRKLKN
jgi:transcriptional regulator with XRE-family HTH domain